MSRSNAKQYVGRVGAGARSRLAPVNPKRNLLYIQNTGVNAGLFRFENDVQLDGGDILLASGAFVLFDVACPIDAINIYSLLGTTFAIIEGMEI